MPRVSPARLGDLPFAFVQTIAVATTAANVLAAAVTFARILGGDRRAVKFRIFMAALNTIAAVETALGAVFMYGTSGIVSLKYESPISALVHLGLWLLQLEMRLLFLLLFSNDLRAGWTESGKNYARATVFAIHMVLWWPVYIYSNVEFTSFMTLWWTYGPTVALFIQAIVTFAQSYIIITTLLRRSKALNGEVTTEQHTVLIISLAVSLVAELCGIVAFLMMSIFLNPAADPDHYWLVVQVAVTAVGWKTLSESLALSRMVRIVAGKQSVARVNSHIVKLMTKIPNLKRSKEYRSSDIATHRSQPVPTSFCAGPPPSMAEQ
ncbi:hypothetical protein HK105_202481 [Polyrhizophydium stewartii]|uniref:Uncharacterized protein n=1 Tax=Polyrhizophydium stewartii TaxID=2732419 RepID=A0ABR4NEW1_9FUNG